MAFTTLPSAGSPLLASTLSSLITETRLITSRLTADTTVVSNSSTLVESGLSVAVSASKVYDMLLWILYNGPSAAADLKIGFSFPSGTTGSFTSIGVDTTDTTNVAGAAKDQTGTHTFGTSASADRVAIIQGTWIVSSTAGNITVQFAQNTPTVANSVLRSGTKLILRQQE